MISFDGENGMGDGEELTERRRREKGKLEECAKDFVGGGRLLGLANFRGQATQAMNHLFFSLMSESESAHRPGCRHFWHLLLFLSAFFAVKSPHHAPT